MKLNLLIGATLVLGLGSCSTAYRSGQTPDDLYYSPGRAQDEYVQVKEKDDRAYNSDNSDDYYEDRYLRMRVANRYQWGVLDDYYFNNPYAYNYYGGAFMGSAWNNPWNSYFLWNNFYNPYSSFYPGFYHGGGFYGGGYYAGGGYYGGGLGGHVINTRVRTPSRPISFNPASYSNGNTRGSNARNYSRSYINNNNGPRYNNSNSNAGGGRYNGSNSNSGRSNNNSSYQPSNNNNSTPSRSYSPPPNSSGTSSGGGSSNSGSTGGGVSRPPR